jgi:hypothetical protein
MPLHSSLTDLDGLHEPKGISTATVNKVYVSDGTGSGNWTHWPTGWSYTQHSGVAQVFSTTAAKLLINGSGANTNIAYLPPQIRGVSTLWSTSSSKITPIALGDSYSIRLDLPVTARVTATEIGITLDIGGASTITNSLLDRYELGSKTAPYTMSTVFEVVILSSAIVTNGIQFFIKTDAGSIDITNPAITITRTNAGTI